MLVVVIGFLGWRFIRPMNIFVVSEAFEKPINTSIIPPPLETLHAEACAACHREIYDEWRTTIHSQAWTDPYFQVDWKFDGYPQICKNCHIPLDRQQEHLVVGFRDKEKWQPILDPNPDFDPKLQREGVTCAVCHLREGEILGTRGSQSAAHPVRKLSDGNQVCAQCHVVGGERWDTFWRFPPCGTVAEIKAVQAGEVKGRVGETVVADNASLGCVECHMPVVERPVAVGGQPRATRKHVWRGGHDPAMVKQGLAIRFEETSTNTIDKRSFTLTLTNVGATHYLPTGTPDRHLTVLDSAGGVLKDKHDTLKRTVMWRPFIVDLWDTRLPPNKPRIYKIDVGVAGKPAFVEAKVRYHLLEERRRRRIGYENTEPIAYEVFKHRIALEASIKKEE